MARDLVVSSPHYWPKKKLSPLYLLLLLRSPINITPLKNQIQRGGQLAMGSPANKTRLQHNTSCSRTHQIGGLLLVTFTFFVARLLDRSVSSCSSPAGLDTSLHSLIHFGNGGSLLWPQLGYGAQLHLRIYIYEEDEIEGLKELMYGRDGKISADSCVKGQWGTQVVPLPASNSFISISPRA